jgi:RimJ/RimL family protein N-acetyltransferase
VTQATNIGSIQTNRLLLERIRPEDVDDMVAMHQDDRFVEVFGHRSTPEHVRTFTAKQIEDWNRLGYGLWTIRDRETGAFIGRGGLRAVTIEGADEVELGYGLRPEWWDRGLATEMAGTGLRVGFERLGLQSIVAFTLPTNVRSRHVMGKLGMTFERDILWADMPHVLYRITRDSRGASPSIGLGRPGPR